MDLGQFHTKPLPGLLKIYGYWAHRGFRKILIKLKQAIPGNIL